MALRAPVLVARVPQLALRDDVPAEIAVLPLAPAGERRVGIARNADPTVAERLGLVPVALHRRSPFRVVLLREAFGRFQYLLVRDRGEFRVVEQFGRVVLFQVGFDGFRGAGFGRSGRGGFDHVREGYGFFSGLGTGGVLFRRVFLLLGWLFRDRSVLNDLRIDLGHFETVLRLGR